MEEYDRCPITISSVYTAREASKVMGCHGGFVKKVLFDDLAKFCVGISMNLRFVAGSCFHRLSDENGKR